MIHVLITEDRSGAGERGGEQSGGERSQSWEKEEVKISRGTDRNKGREIREREMENVKGEGMTTCLQRDVGPF